MNDAIAISQPKFEFPLKLKKEKAKVKESLRGKLQDEKLDMAKRILVENGVEINQEITSIKELKEYIKKYYTPDVYADAEKIIDTITNNLDDLLNKLENNSMDAIGKFIKKTEMLIAPLTKSLTKGLATRTAVALAPTVVSKLVVSATALGLNAYKLIKNKDKRVIANQQTELNKILQELEVRIINDKVVESRFSEEVQEEIRNFLKKNKIEFNDTGYLSLRDAINNLDFDYKKELCQLLNSKLGKELKIEERLEAKKGGFFNKVKKAKSHIAKGVGGGITTALAINQIDPAIIAAPVNGTVVGSVIQKIFNNGWLSGITGGLSAVATAVLEHVPIIGDTWGDALELENFLICGTVGAGLGVAGMLTTSVINTIKNTKNSFDYMKLKKEILAFDNQKYKEDNQVEYKKMRELILTKENSLEEEAIIDFIHNYIKNDLNNYVEKPKNVTELMQQIDSLDDSSKRKLTIFIEKLKDYNTNNYSDFTNFLIKSGKTLSTLTLLGLSGLSIYDIAKSGEFLPSLSAKLFKDVPNNVYLMETRDVVESVNKTPTNEGNRELLSNIPEDELPHTREMYGDLLIETKRGTAFDGLVENGKIDLQNSSNDLNQVIKEPTKSIPEKLADLWNDLIGKDSDPVFPTDNVDLSHSTSNIASSYAANSGGTLSNGTLNSYAASSNVSNIGEFMTNNLIPKYDEIKNYIDSLTNEEQINLIYYFNSLPKNRTNVTYEAISTILQDKYINGLKDIIINENKKIEMTKNISNLINLITSTTLTTTNAYSEVATQASGHTK